MKVAPVRRRATGEPAPREMLLRKFGRYGLLVIDEWLLNKPDSLFRAMFLELMGLRYGSSSTVFCTQYRPKDWHARLGGGLHAEAIMDRIVHGTVWLKTGGINMRDIYG